MDSGVFDALKELENYLWSHGHKGQGSVVSDLLRMRGDDGQAFVSMLQGGEMWGGAGAVWETVGFGDNDREFRSAIIRLADAMDHGGVGTDRSRSIADTLREWRRKGI